MDLLTVFVHYDVHGLVAPHVENYLQSLASVSSRLIVVSTAPLTPSSRSTLTSYGALIERANEGYDFLSWRTGLGSVPGWERAHRLLLANDSTVGPLVPMDQMLDRLDHQGCDVGGVTISNVSGQHVQSYFFRFGPQVLASPTFQAFWLGMPTVSVRKDVIRLFELGLSRLLRTAGFSLGSIFEPSARELRLAHARVVASAPENRSIRKLVLARAFLDGRRRSEPVDLSLALADRALDNARLPLVKLSFFRDDPFAVGAESVLSRCEAKYPKQFDGVRDYIERVRPEYRRR
ncbi:MAG: rhamnan synthesis F family protein [Candidatus Nanopelagicales bacterium]